MNDDQLLDSPNDVNSVDSHMNDDQLLDSPNDINSVDSHMAYMMLLT